MEQTCRSCGVKADEVFLIQNANEDWYCAECWYEYLRD